MPLTTVSCVPAGTPVLPAPGFPVRGEVGGFGVDGFDGLGVANFDALWVGVVDADGEPDGTTGPCNAESGPSDLE